MAQANVVNITGETSGKSAERLERDAKLANAFRDMESDLHDLRYMASHEQKSEALTATASPDPSPPAAFPSRACDS